MASTILPKLLLSIPRLSSHSPPPNKLSIPQPSRGFSFSLHHSLPPQLRVSFALVPRRNFAARAEFESVSGGGEEAVGTDDVEEDVVEEGAVAVLEAEEKEKGEEEEGKEPRQPRIKLGEIMGILNKRAVEASEKVRPVPDIRTGDIIEIKLEVPETKRRLSVYKGIVMSKQNAGIHSTIRVRRVIAGVGVEIVFPLYSPNIKELKVLSHRKVRRARLYYLRDKLPRLSTFK